MRGEYGPTPEEMGIAQIRDHQQGAGAERLEEKRNQFEAAFLPKFREAVAGDITRHMDPKDPRTDRMVQEIQSADTIVPVITYGDDPAEKGRIRSINYGLKSNSGEVFKPNSAVTTNTVLEVQKTTGEEGALMFQIRMLEQEKAVVDAERERFAQQALQNQLKLDQTNERNRTGTVVRSSDEANKYARLRNEARKQEDFWRSRNGELALQIDRLRRELAKSNRAKAA
ncbi:MAG: hypothetical protein HY545_01095 [Candidatus Doudnabacteria bacterium]|nr:hypothetical protein [Candidatus Doudnabacteria bacterium]